MMLINPVYENQGTFKYRGNAEEIIDKLIKLIERKERKKND